MRIWKFPLELTDAQTVMLPKGADIIAIEQQHLKLQLWALCDEEAEKQPRGIAIYGTGHPISDEPGRHISTFQIGGGEFVFHAFEVMP